jgi:hypothetical protein
MAGTAVTREQILAYRLQRHHLARRLPAGALAEAAAVCGLQNSPPGAALLSLHARVAAASAAALDEALLAAKSLVQVWSVRAAPLLVPVPDAAIFTHGLLPGDEEETRCLMRGAVEHLQRSGLAATDLVNWTAAALDAVLDGRELTKDELGVELSRRLAQHIPAEQRELWISPDEWGHFGESLARFALNVVALRGAFCLLSHPGRAATFVRADQWLGQPFVAPPDAAGELLRRYLAAYGPSTRAHFAQWAGIAPGQAQRSWQRLAGELVPVQWGRKTLWLHSGDLPGLLSAELPPGVRLLPPHDPYLAARDRDLLLPDKSRHAQTWRTAGSPGVVLYNGAIVAIWRAQKKQDDLQVTVAAFAVLPPTVRSAIEAEAGAVALLRGCCRATVSFTL